MADDLETTTAVEYLRKGYGIVKTGLGCAGAAVLAVPLGMMQWSSHCGRYDDMLRMRRRLQELDPSYRPPIDENIPPPDSLGSFISGMYHNLRPASYRRGSD